MTNSIPELPDFLGKAGRVTTVAELLTGGQAQLAALRAQRVLNRHEITDPLPGTNPEGITYERRFKELEAGMAELLTENADIHDELVAAAVKSRRDAENRL